MKHHTKSTQIILRRGYDFLLLMSLWCEASRKMCGSAIHKEVLRINFTQRSIDHLLYYFVHDSNVIILCIIVDDTAFTSNSPELLKKFKEKMADTLGVNFYAELKSFSRRKITRPPSALYVTETFYLERILHRFSMLYCNHVLTPPSNNAERIQRLMH